VSNEVK